MLPRIPYHTVTDLVTALGTVVAAFALLAALRTIRDGNYANANGWILELDKSLIFRGYFRREPSAIRPL